MKPFLLYRDTDFNLQRRLPTNELEMAQDLELNTLFKTMSNEDELLLDVTRKVVISSLIDVDTILYRQNILKDCLQHPAIVGEIYTLMNEAIITQKKQWLSIFSIYPSSIVSSAIAMLRMLLGVLKKLRQIADEHSHEFESEGFKVFFTMLQTELSDEYFATIEYHFMELQFKNGMLLGSELGDGNESKDYTLQKSEDSNESWARRLFGKKPRSYAFYTDGNDYSGPNNYLWELKERGINLVANTLAQSADHINNFIKMLRIELAFYIACLNLYDRLVQLNEPVTFPTPINLSECRFACRGLYDVCLALTANQKVVGNDVDADNKDMVIITGANQGGKSTFLRSVGLSQLMMQCGMFVPAESFCSNVCNGLFTHFRREEDVTMKSGKFEEELSRVSFIADNLKSSSLVLFNESFSTTNEREGSEIARQITGAMIENRIKVFFVTHLYEFAHWCYEYSPQKITFLRAERQSDGTRTFKLIPGEPLQTSYGQDLYNRIFGGNINK